MTVCNFIQELFLQLRSYPAGRAETAAFVREEVGVIAHRLQDIAPAPKYGEGSRCRQILERNAALEFLPGNKNAGPPT